MEVQKINIQSHVIQEGGKLSHMTNEQKHTKSTIGKVSRYLVTI